MTIDPFPQPRTVTLVAVSPWSQLNDYEGEVEIDLGDRRLHCRVVLPSGQWDAVRPGERVIAALWLARSGEVALLDAAAAAEPGLRQLRGVAYEAVGRVEAVDDEQLRLDCGAGLGGAGRLLDVDLELTPALRQQLHVAPGAQLRVVGTLQLDLDPDQDADPG
jgi:hypothetical protein